MERHIQNLNLLSFHGIQQKGCSYCKGYGKIYDWMKEDLPASGDWWKLEDGSTCPKCEGQRLNKSQEMLF